MDEDASISVRVFSTCSALSEGPLAEIVSGRAPRLAAPVGGDVQLQIARYQLEIEKVKAESTRQQGILHLVGQIQDMSPAQRLEMIQALMAGTAPQPVPEKPPADPAPVANAPPLAAGKPRRASAAKPAASAAQVAPLPVQAAAAGASAEPDGFASPARVPGHESLTELLVAGTPPMVSI